MKKEGL